VAEIESFGNYVLCGDPLRLMEGRRIVTFSTRQLRIVAILVRAHGKLVTKKFLLDTIWKDSFVGEGSLSQTVFLIRKTLGKLPDGGEYIETVPRQGYRLAPLALKKKSVNETTTQFATGSRIQDGDQFRLLVEAIQDYAIYMLDCGGRVITWNLGAEKSKGFTSREVVGQHFSMFFVGEDIEAHVPEKELATATRIGHCVGEGWRIRKNGERFWASFEVTAMRSPHGKLLGFAKVVRDLSERKRQEDQLRRMECVIRRERDRFLAAADSSMDAIYICECVRDQNGEIEDFVFSYLNSNVEKMVSISREVLLGGKMCELLPVNRTHGLFDAYKRVVETGVAYVAEFPIQDENVMSEWIRVQAVRLEDGVAITAADITERKRAEQRFLYLADHDPLTGLANRSVLLDRIGQEIARADDWVDT
jgi:PAS domain S-box-containing protein